MEIKLADKHNFTHDSLKDFQRYQEVKNVYRLHEGKMILVYNPFIEDWDATRRLQKAEDILSGKYETYCAFEENCVGYPNTMVSSFSNNDLICASSNGTHSAVSSHQMHQLLDTVLRVPGSA